jgi:hypothetical protein
MAIIFEEIETSVVDAPVSTRPDQRRDPKVWIDPAEVRRTFEVMAQRAARLAAD